LANSATTEVVEVNKDQKTSSSVRALISILRSSLLVVVHKNLAHLHTLVQ